jgi:hypothetical protein
MKLNLKDSRFFALSALFIFTAGLILTLHGITHESIWFDESYTAAAVTHSFAGVIANTVDDVHPPLYYVMLKIFTSFFGHSVFALRLFSVLGLCALAPLAMGPIKKIFGASSALIYMVIVFFTPISLSVGQDARMYTWACFFVTGAVLYGYMAVRDGGKANWRIFTVFALASVYTHVYALLEMALLYAILAVHIARNDRRKAVPFLISAASVFLLFLPWLFVLVRQAGAVIREFWIPRTTLHSVIEALYYPYGTKFSTIGDSVAGNVGLLSAVVFTGIGLFTDSDENTEGDSLARTCLAVMAMTLISAYLISVTVKPIFYPRYFYTVFGLYAVLVMFGISKINFPVAKIVICVLLVGLSVPQLLFVNKFRFNGPMDEVVAMLGDKAAPDDAFLFGEEQTFGTFNFYFPESRQYLYIQEGPEGYGKYDVFAPNGSYGNDYRPFIAGSESFWLVNRGEQSPDVPADFLALEDVLKDRTLFQASRVYSFRLPFSWFNVQCVKVTRNPSLAFTMDGTADELQVTMTDFDNDEGRCYLSVYDLDGFSIMKEYQRTKIVPARFPEHLVTDTAGKTSVLTASDLEFLQSIYTLEDGYYVKQKEYPSMSEEKKLLELFAQKLIRQFSADIKNKEAVFELKNIPYGEYLMIAHHDENSNGILDVNHYRPVEALGFSGTDGKSTMETKFQYNSVLVREKRVTVDIKMYNYRKR